MITLLIASLTVAAPGAVAAPALKPGHYYRVAFAESVAKGTFDPDAFVTHREPSVRWTPPRAAVDFGQEIESHTVRATRTGTVVQWEQKSATGAWVPLTVKMLAPDRMMTDLAGELETWVRLPYAFPELARRTRETRTAALRSTLLGRYRDAAGHTLLLGPRTGFALSRCLESCRTDAAAWCVVHARKTYRVDGAALVEVAAPEGLCPDGHAFEPKPSGARFERVAK